MAKINKMEKFGFEGADSIPQLQRLVMAIQGREGDGKTHFSLTMPGDIAFINLDEGLEGVIEKFSDQKKIHLLHLDVPDASLEEDLDVKTQAKEQWDKFIKGYYGALRSSDIRSITIDTASELRDLLLLADFGRKSQILPYMYREPNSKLRKVIKDALKYDKNVIFLQKMKPVYINDKRTGDYEPMGLSDMGHLVQMDCRIEQYQDESGNWDFRLTVNKCRPNQDVKGMEFTGEMVNFPTLAGMILPDVDPERWE